MYTNPDITLQPVGVVHVLVAVDGKQSPRRIDETIELCPYS